jgi:TolB-like protein/predicted Ser/Thr protein kinase
MSLRAGARLGPYEVIGSLGAGGMGEVYRARDTRLDRIVALKVSHEQFSARVEREARAIAALNHAHICHLYDIGPNYLVMEYLEGTHLQGRLPLDEALKYTIQICDALEVAHSKGIIHRDLKPANILVTSAGVKLLDFGLAQLAAAPAVPDDVTMNAGLTQAGTILGTAAYMSPEQAAARPVDARSDIFSLGVVLYEMLSGRRAFNGDSSVAVMAAVLEREPEQLDAPEAVRKVVARCIRKSPAERFQSAAELRGALGVLAVPKAADERPSIAVLPFANMSRDADDEYFSDGLAEEIINALVKVPGLKVIARTSAFAFKGQNIDIRKIADVLGVTTVLEGSVRRAGTRLRVTAQLIAAADGSHLWSERYDRQMEDLFEMQDEIAAAIASELKLKFAPAPAARPRRQPDLQAYEAYLRYRQYQWMFTPEALGRSRECLEQAIALDPEFALPYVGLADHYFASTTFGHADELVPQARRLAERALKLDPDLPEAHGMLGVLAAIHNPDWKEAERRLRIAMAREPVSWHVRSWYSTFFLRRMGRNEEARREAERALEDNPLSQLLHWCLANVLEGMGLEADAQAAFEKAVDLDPQFWLGWFSLAVHHATCGRQAAAVAAAEKASSIFPNLFVTGVLAALQQGRGEPSSTADLLPDSDRGDAPSVTLACFHLVRRDIDAAVDWAGKALDDGYALFTNFVIFPFEPWLRQSSGWPGLMRRLNLPDTR